MHLDDFRMAPGAGRGRMDVKLSEQSTEILMLFQRHILIAKKQNKMGH